jgi:hypothetical protein
MGRVAIDSAAALASKLVDVLLATADEVIE